MNGHCNDAAHNHNCEEQSRYETVLNQYSSAPDQKEIAQAVKRADETAEKNNTKEVLKEIYSCLDLTTLKCTDNAESVLAMTEKVNELEDKYPALKSENVKTFLKDNGLKLMGSFLESSDGQMLETARKLGEILKILSPDLSDEVDAIIG